MRRSSAATESGDARTDGAPALVPALLCIGIRSDRLVEGPDLRTELLGGSSNRRRRVCGAISDGGGDGVRRWMSCRADGPLQTGHRAVELVWAEAVLEVRRRLEPVGEEELRERVVGEDAEARRQCCLAIYGQHARGDEPERRLPRLRPCGSL